MLRLRRLSVEGFGPFADRQVISFPPKPGITVIYGENMRGKTSLLNAIRYAFFGTVVGRGSHPRKLHVISNRDLAAEGRFGFTVGLEFDHEGQQYELVRICQPRISNPQTDDDYEQEVMLRRASAPLGPQEREHALQVIFPQEISRFFLFDGELLQEYEELLINESETGHRISQAIERILGVPILKRGRIHLTQLSEEADKQAAKEATKHQETEAIGTALQQLTLQRQAHRAEIDRLTEELRVLNIERAEAERFLQSKQKYAGIIQARDEAAARLDKVTSDRSLTHANLQRAMSIAWRTVLRERVRSARQVAQQAAQRDLDAMMLSLRERAASSGHCDTCGQDVPEHLRDALRAGLKGAKPESGTGVRVTDSMMRLSDLNRFEDADNVSEIRQLWSRLRELDIEAATLKDRISDYTTELADSDADTLRRTKASYAEIIEKITVVRQAIDREGQKADEKDQSIQRHKKKLDASGAPNLRSSQARARILRDTAEVFGGAIERYKNTLRGRVEATATELFLAMTTEKQDYASLSINPNYGLTIKHRDGRAEDARSAGAEHVVALALMGALQRNAPLRGPIVMDSPFGRLDERHTSNVVQALPRMAEQIVLLVYEAEVGKTQMRNLLGSHLIREYELERQSSRRTVVREVK